ncbi:nucleolar protein 13-like [Olea europaea var. sylvestris]|uniref:nucleolar protein 13-like n=1 Tax=Olea europaea var. sylvestris TaxID=158386 RepID=UPI000C1D036B|nr:nucleolar protein 13-like [Olea europaea var. sylvestris]
MSGREARGRSRRDYPAKSEEKSQHGRGNNPPSRHLWVGNLSHNLTENDLAHQFLKFGDLESLAFQLGRSYAFINYRNDKDAFLAVRELQGFVLAGNPLKIEFAKAVSFVDLCLLAFWYHFDATSYICTFFIGSMESMAIQDSLVIQNIRSIHKEATSCLVQSNSSITYLRKYEKSVKFISLPLQSKKQKRQSKMLCNI